MIDYGFDPFEDQPWKRKVVTDPVTEAYGDQASLQPSVQITPALPEPVTPESAPVTPAYDPATGAQAAQEDPFGDQPTRHAAYTRWQAMTPEDRQLVFDQAVDVALTAEGITDPAKRAEWKQAMTLVAKGDAKTPGENPALNPFAQAYDLDDRPARGVNPRLEGTPQGDATASTARGYFQFLTKGNGPTPSTWDLVRLPSKDGEEELARDAIFDPVSNARGFIRAVNRSTNYQSPLDPWKEKQKIKVWNPMLPLPIGASR
jgi:hypothetical protein